ncbi:hypothetical protein ACQJBY_041083 [Aegilops geniculata]
MVLIGQQKFLQGSMVSDHEASTSKAKPRDPKYTQPKWCPPGLTKTMKRRLERMRNHEKVEHKEERQRDELLSEIRPMAVTKQVWRPKQKENADASTLATATHSPPKEDDATPITSSTPPETSPSVEESLSPIFTLGDEDEMVDYESTPVREGMDINMVYYLPAEFRAIGEEGEVAQLDFGPKNAIFEKPKEPVKHLKALYLKGHINGLPVARMLVDGGAVVNITPYSVFKKLDLDDNALMKTNMVLNGFEGKEKTQAKGVMCMELTVGSKTLATTFFIAKVQGNYSAILGRDWVHANQCVPSTMHQFLIQWVDDEVEVIHADNSACVALADASVDWNHPDVTFLTGRDLSEFDFLSATRNGFIPISLKPIGGNRFQGMM